MSRPAERAPPRARARGAARVSSSQAGRRVGAAKPAHPSETALSASWIAQHDDESSPPTARAVRRCRRRRAAGRREPRPRGATSRAVAPAVATAVCSFSDAAAAASALPPRSRRPDGRGEAPARGARTWALSGPRAGARRRDDDDDRRVTQHVTRLHGVERRRKDSHGERRSETAVVASEPRATWRVLGPQSHGKVQPPDLAFVTAVRESSRESKIHLSGAPPPPPRRTRAPPRGYSARRPRPPRPAGFPRARRARRRAAPFASKKNAELLHVDLLAAGHGAMAGAARARAPTWPRARARARARALVRAARKTPALPPRAPTAIRPARPQKP